MKHFHGFILTGCLTCLLCGCYANPQPVRSTVVDTVTGTPVNTASPIPFTPTPSQTPTITLTPTASHTPTPLPDLRLAPMTLMLHRPNPDFDTIAFLEEFIAILKQEDMLLVTYQDLSLFPYLTATEHDRLMIITIDDIYLRYPIDADMLQMIDLLKAAGYPAVLGVITENYYTDPDTVATLQELSDLGWEIATHTDTHRNLLEVQQISPKAIFPEVRTSLDKIESAIGLRPITLVLPLGQMTYGDEQIKRTGVQWVVGINGGNEYKMSAAYYYVGREGPDGNAQETFEIIKQRFGNQDEGNHE